ncbi:MAG: methyltransferase domain-containing protein [Clostridia bacterium]|nr:methyltransferase domain-containing protein [Clostridia bacterium]
MLYKMKLNESPFERMKNGTKTIEFRLYDEKRQQIKVEDQIEFSKLPDLEEKLLVDVTQLYRENTFEKLFRKLYTDEEEIKRMTKGMYEIYSPEEEQQYGVLGIKIKVKKDFKDYYNATINNQPSPLIRRIFFNKYNEEMLGNTAIDLGCGTGNDTQFLISKGVKVTAVDNQEVVRDILKSKNLDKEKLDILIGDFAKIELPKADLIYANMSLFYIKENFELFIKNLIEKVNKNGLFAANFLGTEDDWSKSKTTVKKEELLNYFEDFEMKYFSEEKFYKDTVQGINKFWHVYTIIGKKK